MNFTLKIRTCSPSSFPDKHCFCGYKSDKPIVSVELFFLKLKYLVIESLGSYVIILLNRFQTIMKGMMPNWISRKLVIRLPNYEN